MRPLVETRVNDIMYGNATQSTNTRRSCNKCAMWYAIPATFGTGLLPGNYSGNSTSPSTYIMTLNPVINTSSLVQAVFFI